MYLDHFGLVADPFSLTPRLDYLYMSEAFEESIAHLAYGLENGEAITLISGLMGTGKTLVLHSFLSHLDPRTCATAMVNTTQLSYLEVLKLALDDLGVDYPAGADRADLLRICKRLAEEANRAGKKILIIVDEAQNLDWRTLEGLRLLTNLDQKGGQGLQLILVGQPDLERMINLPELAQLKQRIRVHYRLDNLNRKELGEYVHHRLKVAGCEREVFKPAALDKIFRLSGGVPRLVNILAGEALLTAYLAESDHVRAEHVESGDAGALPGAAPPPAQAEDRHLVERLVEEHIVERIPPAPAPPPPAAAERAAKEEAAPPRAVAPVPEETVTPTAPAEWAPTMAHHRQRGHGRAVLLIAVCLVVAAALAWFVLLPLLQPRSGIRTVEAPPPAATAGDAVLAATVADEEPAAPTGTPPSTEAPAATDEAGSAGSGATDADDPAAGPGGMPSEPSPSPAASADEPVAGTPARPAPARTEPAAPSRDAAGLVQEPLAVDTPGYAVHISSFRESARAFAACDRLRAEGLPAFCREKLIQGRRWFRVFVGPYAERHLANDAIQKLRGLGWESYYRVMKLQDVG